MKINEFINILKKETKLDQYEIYFLIESLLDITSIDLLINLNTEYKELSKYMENKIIDRINNLEPIQYITNSSIFYGKNFYVDQNVLIPRKDTEFLIETIIDENKNENLKVLDLATGSGAIAITLSNLRDNWNIIASDFSLPALKVAQKNNINNKNKVIFYWSDLFESIHGKFDLIISNPPYIPIRDKKIMDKSVYMYEPKEALFADDEGFFFYKKIASKLSNFLTNDGKAYFEIGFDQGERAVEIFEENGFSASFLKDINENQRILKVQKR